MKTKPTKIAKNQKAEIPLVDMTPGELTTKAGQLKTTIVKVKLEMAAGRLKNRKQAFTLKKELARVLTILRVKSA